MKIRLTLSLLCFAALCFQGYGQNTAPYWSLAGNSTATTSSKLGTTTAVPLNLTTNNATRLSISSDGNVGIGTTSPQQRLHVEGTANQAIFVSTTAPSTTSGSGMIGSVKATPTASGQRLGYLQFGSRGGAQNNYNQAGMAGYAGGAWSSTSHPAYLTFETTPSGSTTRVERLRIDQNGHLLPAKTKAYDLGSASLSFRNLYLRDDIYLDGTRFVSNAPGTANANAFVGSNSGLSITTGAYNTAVGHDALRKATTGSMNTALGDSALLTVGSGTSNTALGYRADVANNLIVNATAIGAGAIATASNQVMLGGPSNSSVRMQNASSTAKYLEFVNTTGTNPDWRLEHDFTGRYLFFSFSADNFSTFRDAANFDTAKAAGFVFEVYGKAYATGVWQSSDAKLKTGVKEFGNATDVISKLKPRTYFYKREDYPNLNLPSEKQYGFVAQELETVLPELVTTAQMPVKITDKGERQMEEIKAVNYTALIPVLVKGAQEQEKTIEADHRQIEDLKKENADLKERLSKIEALLSSNTGTTTFAGSYLESAVPNPAQATTLIRYKIPANATGAKLTLVNAKGQVMKEVSLNKTGSGQVNLNTQALAMGMYTYTLWVAGQQADSKQLVIAR